ncbi:metal ABC transporter permease [Candidatus Ishikawella capsulata]|uniref:metal ABC transporter permease n=1 Tax=Candidatus Ishikawella capsulata TaxID=168169 RepID=UPI0011DE12C2|nr:metal ABC transporter permease [Candidatus Ishikawaella capsulata]
MAALLPSWLCSILLTLATSSLGSFIIWRRISWRYLAHASLLRVYLGLFFI